MHVSCILLISKNLLLMDSKSPEFDINWTKLDIFAKVSIFLITHGFFFAQVLADPYVMHE